MPGKHDELPSGQMEINLKWIVADLVAAIKRDGIRYFAIIAIVGMLFSICTFLFCKPCYESTAVFTVSTSFTSDYELISEETKQTNDFGKFFSAILTSDALRTLVASEMGYEREEEFTPLIMASSVNNTNLINLRIRADSPQLAQATLQTVLDHYPDVSRQILGEVELHPVYKSELARKPDDQTGILQTGLQGALGSMIILLVLGFLSSVFRNTIRSEEDIIQLFNIDWIGILPPVSFIQKEQQNRELTILSENISPQFKDCLLSLRNRIEKQICGPGRKTIIVTSALQGEGCTTIANNLVRALKMRPHHALQSTKSDHDTEYNIVDAPPSAYGAEALEIAENADACIFVIRQNYASVETIHDSITAIQEMDCPVLGCVLNCMEPEGFKPNLRV